MWLEQRESETNRRKTTNNHNKELMENIDINYWIITVKEPHCSNILRGLKTMEIRRRIPGIDLGDVIFIVRAGEDGHIVGACLVWGIYVETVSYFCNYFRNQHRLKPDQLKEYAKDKRYLAGIELKRLHLVEDKLNVRHFGYTRAPQWFYRIKADFYKNIPTNLINI